MLSALGFILPERVRGAVHRLRQRAGRAASEVVTNAVAGAVEDTLERLEDEIETGLKNILGGVRRMREVAQRSGRRGRRGR